MNKEFGKRLAAELCSARWAPTGGVIFSGVRASRWATWAMQELTEAGYRWWGGRTRQRGGVLPVTGVYGGRRRPRAAPATRRRSEDGEARGKSQGKKWSRVKPTATGRRRWRLGKNRQGSRVSGRRTRQSASVDGDKAWATRFAKDWGARRGSEQWWRPATLRSAQARKKEEGGGGLDDAWLREMAKGGWASCARLEAADARGAGDPTSGAVSAVLDAMARGEAHWVSAWGKPWSVCRGGGWPLGRIWARPEIKVLFFIYSKTFQRIWIDLIKRWPSQTKKIK
jgi:hypothetical protein